MSTVNFKPKYKAESRNYICGICNRDIISYGVIDYFPICHMCRWFCSVEGRWGHRYDGIRCD